MEKLVLAGVTHPGSIELAAGFVTVGRNPTNDFRVPDATVSSFHCELVIADGTVTVRDLNSTNGTFVDGRQVQESVLNPGQALRLGQAELRLESQPVRDDVRIAIPEVRAEPAPAQTHLLDGSLACLNHPGVPAILRCGTCGQAYCGDCVKPLGLRGGEARLFCPHCSAACTPIEPPGPRKKRKASLLGRLTQTIRIRWR